ncbi:MAG: glycosyltransferase family 4 protein [Bacteroidales bacterium]|nr:glycosyltransferase family 4 protein [Bacteroidales bacterium]
MKKVIIVAFDYYAKNIPLQPWKYIHELALAHQSVGNDVKVLSNSNTQHNDNILGIEVKYISKLSPVNNEIAQIINNWSADIIYWWASPRTFLYKSQFKKIQGKVNLLYTGPLYNYNEIIKAWRFLPFSNIKPYLIDVCTPKFLFKNLVNSVVIDKIITISKRNEDRFIKLGINQNKIETVYIGKDPIQNEKSINQKRNNNTFLYITSATKIRGIELLLKAFSKLKLNYPNIQLKILARPSPEYNKNKLINICNKLNITNQVTITDGWLERKEIEQELKQCRALIMPFILVPSEMPLSVIESFSMNTPVIVPDIDGLPEMVNNRGWIFKQGSINDLSKSIKQALLLNEHEYLKLQEKITTYYNNLSDWPSVMQQLINTN